MRISSLLVPASLVRAFILLNKSDIISPHSILYSMLRNYYPAPGLSSPPRFSHEPEQTKIN
jgi:uncharacterized RDD family membrane protein YckC